MKHILSYKIFIIYLFINTICDIDLFNAHETHETPLKLVYHRLVYVPAVTVRKSTRGRSSLVDDVQFMCSTAKTRINRLDNVQFRCLIAKTEIDKYTTVDS